MPTWIEKLESFCEQYSIPIEYLAETLNEPKVIPMVRGKAFEFSAYEKLLHTLNEQTWLVEKPAMNAQFGFHDEDVRVTHRATNIRISIECKLAAKGRFKKLRDGSHEIGVKCMRSRTLGASKVQVLAPKLGISIERLTKHNDQYVPSDFDVVLTSIGNAFYETEEEKFQWSPPEDAVVFLKSLFNTEDINLLKHLAFEKMFIAKSKDLTIHSDNAHTCTRRGCDEITNCGFIPNYPIIKFPPNTNNPNGAWTDLENSEMVFDSIIQSKLLALSNRQL